MPENFIGPADMASMSSMRLLNRIQYLTETIVDREAKFLNANDYRKERDAVFAILAERFEAANI